MTTQEYIDIIDTKYKELQQAVRGGFMEIILPIFEKHPHVEKVSFRCYQSYFNDGDDTYYAVYADTDCIEINGKDSYECNENEDDLYSDARFDFSEAVSLDEKYAKILYGDHVQITLTRDGMTIEEYTEHD